MKLETQVFIPARMNSSRFPGKLLKKVNGKPVLWYTWKAAKDAGIGPVCIITDSDEILDTMEAFEATTLRTDDWPENGTERCANAANLLGLHPQDKIINVQGDHCGMTHRIIRFFAYYLESRIPILSSDPEKRFVIHGLREAVELPMDRGDVRLIAGARVTPEGPDNNRRAVFFQRSYYSGAFKHTGIYGYSVAALAHYLTLSKELDSAESLEQMRWISHGLRFECELSPESSGISINNEEDLEKFQALPKTQSDGERFNSRHPRR